MPQALTYQQIIALSKETNWGDGTATTVVIPVTEGAIQPQVTSTFDEGRRGIGAAEFDVVRDAGHGEINMSGWVYADRIGHLLMGMLGADTKTGTSDPWSHALALNAAPPSYNIEERIISGASGGIKCPGSRFGTLNFTFDTNTGALTYTAQAQGKIPELATTTDPAVGTVSSPFEGWKATVTSSGLNARTVSGEINMSREIQVVHTGENSQQPTSILVGPLKIEGSLLMITDSLADLTAYLDGTRQSLAIAFSKGATPNRSITFTMTDAYLAAAPLEFDYGGIGVFNRIHYRGLYNATDAGPCAVTLLNGQNAAY